MNLSKIQYKQYIQSEYNQSDIVFILETMSKLIHNVLPSSVVHQPEKQNDCKNQADTLSKDDGY
jgi:hypothetical protein